MVGEPMSSVASDARSINESSRLILAEYLEGRGHSTSFKTEATSLSVKDCKPHDLGRLLFIAIGRIRYSHKLLERPFEEAQAFCSPGM